MFSGVLATRLELLQYWNEWSYIATHWDLKLIKSKSWVIDCFTLDYLFFVYFESVYVTRYIAKFRLRCYFSSQKGKRESWLTGKGRRQKEIVIDWDFQLNKPDLTDSPKHKHPHFFPSFHSFSFFCRGHFFLLHGIYRNLGNSVLELSTEFLWSENSTFELWHCH